MVFILEETSAAKELTHCNDATLTKARSSLSTSQKHNWALITVKVMARKNGYDLHELV